MVEIWGRAWVWLARKLSSFFKFYFQLMRLGYQIYPLSPKDQKNLIRADAEKWAHRILANILSGTPQHDPNPKGIPVY